MQITEEQIRKIAVSHQRQMASVHPLDIIGTIEDAINEALVIAGVMPALQHSDDMCFHECPYCNCRCNCSNQPCSCCNEV